MDKPQNYDNHARVHPIYHFFAMPLTLIFLMWSIIRFAKSPDADTLYLLTGSMALLGVTLVSRLSPLRAQDRLIRLEERLRFERLLSPELFARATNTLEPRHYIALRFAADSELHELVAHVLSNPAMSTKQIKKEIRNWRADTFRV